MQDKASSILSIAGSDSFGGAGIQADARIAALLGCRCANAITSVTAQNLDGVHSVYNLPKSIVEEQIHAAIASVSAVKIGMLGSADIIDAVFDALLKIKLPIVLDPVFIATSGAFLIKQSEFNNIKKLISICHLVTPNIQEAEVLCGISIKNKQDMIKASLKILELGAKNTLIKGGHMQTTEIVDILTSKDSSIFEFPHKKMYNIATHGTGCRLSCAIACNIAKGFGLHESIKKSIDLTMQEIEKMQYLYY